MQERGKAFHPRPFCSEKRMIPAWRAGCRVVAAWLKRSGAEASFDQSKKSDGSVTFHVKPFREAMAEWEGRCKMYAAGCAAK